MAYETILTEVEDGVGIVTLNRPESLNAMNRQLVKEQLSGFEGADKTRHQRLIFRYVAGIM